MLRFVLASITGWAAVLGTGIETALPYIFRNSAVRTPNLKTRMWPHYWLGYALAALVLAHTSLVGAAMERSDAIGIWAATLALGFLFLQVGFGLILKAGSRRQRQLRRWHFWSMISFIGLLVVHIARNG